MNEQQFPEKIYYMVVDEKSTGPFTFEEVVGHRAFAPHTLVWKPGIDNWVAAQSLQEFSQYFSRSQNSSFQTPPHYSQPSQEDTYSRQRQEYNQSSHSNNQNYNNSYRQENNGDPNGSNPENNEGNPFANNPQYQSDHTYQQGYHQHHTRYEGNQYYDQRYNRYNNQNGYRPAFRTNWLPWAIVATVVGFFTSCIGAIFGIIGIVQANKANTLYAQGLDFEADSANANAKTMTIIGLIFAGLGILAWLFFGNFMASFY